MQKQTSRELNRGKQSLRKSKRTSNQNPNLIYETLEPKQLLSVNAGSSTVAAEIIGPSVTQWAQNQIANSPDTAYLQQGESELQFVDIESTRNDSAINVVFQQTLHGLPVHGGYVSAQQSLDGENFSVDNRTIDGLYVPVDSMTPTLDFESATEIANAEFAATHQQESTGELVWFREGERAKLAWSVDTSIKDYEGQPLEFTMVIDAHSGQVLSHVQSSATLEAILNDDGTGIFPRIVINDAVGASGSQAYAAPFDSVVALTLGCTGTLVASDVVISARHCGAGAGDTIRFGDDSGSPIYTATVQSSSLPDGNGSLLDGGDVSILTLTQDVPTNIATPMQFIEETTGLEGQLAATLGYGYNGIGSQGHQFSSDGIRWGGENIIDVYGTPASSSGSNIISTDFDDGSNGANTISGSDANPLTNEATTAPGDSGGAVFIQNGSDWVIAGVLSGGTSSTSVYGDISWWTGTAIYRAEIEAAGGVFVGGGLGSVALNQSSYFVGDSISISVNDSNATGPIDVTLVSDSGDTETVTLSGSGPFTGSLITSDGSVSAEDGVLQVSVDDQVTVTYVDPDDGTGNSNTVTATADIIEQSLSVLVGVDFGETGTGNPGNWLGVGTGSDTTLNDLSDENGTGTIFDLSIAETVDGSWTEYAVTPATNTIPQHSNALGAIGGQIYTGADPLELVYSDLQPLVEYEVYVLAAEGFYASIQQSVTLTGDGAAISFDQNFATDQLFINDQIGDSSRGLAEYAQIVTADASGQITINVDPIGGTQDVVLAGVAIFEMVGEECGETITHDATPLNNGVAVSDAATGYGFLMYSEESVSTRFGDLNPNNADHFVAVRLEGSQWQYNNNNASVAASWVDFTPVASDILVAEVDFTNDFVASLIGANFDHGGIAAGFSGGDLGFQANMWAGSTNAGEFGLTGTFFETYSLSDPLLAAGVAGNGVAVADNATGTGYMLYSVANVHDRFGDLNQFNAAHFAAVRLNGSQWQYNNNLAWVNFTPDASDVLVAELDFSADTVNRLQGTSSTIGGVAAGYTTGDIGISSNEWNGNTNAGEFGIYGSFFGTVDGDVTTYAVSPVNKGVAVTDNATGAGYLLHSMENLHLRFGDLNASNADFYVAVRDNGGQWQYNNNLAWVNFTPEATDRLVAEVDFTADTVNSLVGTDTIIGGIAAGFTGGDIAFAANVWNGSANAGEFGVSGTSFTVGEESCSSSRPGRSMMTHDGSAERLDAIDQGVASFDLSKFQGADSIFFDSLEIEEAFAGPAKMVDAAALELVGSVGESVLNEWQVGEDSGVVAGFEALDSVFSVESEDVEFEG